jgi:lysophospholipase
LIHLNVFLVDYRSIFRMCTLEKFHVHTSLNEKVGLLRLFPSITAELVRAFLCQPIEGIVLQTYGAGNVPSNREDILTEFKAAADRGVIIVNISQCPEGSVSSMYEVGKIFMEAGKKIYYKK